MQDGGEVVSAIARWNALVESVNGRRVGRDEEDSCEVYAPGRPGFGDCGTDGHYMCLECREMSAAAIRFREDDREGEWPP